MLQGLKFISRDQIDDGRDETLNDPRKQKRKSEDRKKKVGRRSKHSRNDSSDEDDDLERVKCKSRKKAKWHSSEEGLSSYSGSSDSSESDHRKKKHSRKKRVKKTRHNDSDNESPSGSKVENANEKQIHEGGGEQNADEKSYRTGDSRDDSDGSKSLKCANILRKEMGLDWMLHSKGNKELPAQTSHSELIKDSPEETTKDNPRELNPYLKNNGSGYPEDVVHMENKNEQLLSSSVVGDGGASWRLKALKRAQEQAVREGMKLHDVVEERWGSMGNFSVSAASQKAAPTYAHLHAIKDRRKGLFTEEMRHEDEENVGIEKPNVPKGMRDTRQQSKKMRVPKVDQSLSWGKSRKLNMPTLDSAILSAAISNNMFSNDGSFMDKFMPVEGSADDPSITSRSSARLDSNESASRENADDARQPKPDGSANQLAAKAMQLRLKGKHEEAEKLMREVENMKERNAVDNKSRRPRVDVTSSSLIMHDVSTRQKNREDDADLHLAQKIMHNNRYSISNQADEEYDYDGSPRKRARKKGGRGDPSSQEITKSANRFLTQQERCTFCFDNPARPKHLVVAIANFTYLSLPQQQPVVPGHCCILTLQHEHSTRSLDDNVWEEVRNFKKCLIMMYAKQEMEVLFMETVTQLARQRRHCLVECIPLPQDIAKQAPLYFKKAIDEAEEEWSQHNAKKLIDTSEKGLRASIPKNFPYFHVEFGVKKGFVHVIEDEQNFRSSSFGFDVVRGMLQLPAEDMHRRRRHEPIEAQKQAVASFARDWQPFDWTRQLDQS